MYFVDRYASDKTDFGISRSGDCDYFVGSRVRVRDACMDRNGCRSRLAAVEDRLKAIIDHAHCSRSADSRIRSFSRLLLYCGSVRKGIRPVLSETFEPEITACNDLVLSCHMGFRGILFHVQRVGCCRIHAALSSLRLRLFFGKRYKDGIADSIVSVSSYGSCTAKDQRGPLVRLPVIAVTAGLFHCLRSLRAGFRAGSGLYVGDRPHRQIIGLQRSLKICAACVVRIGHGQRHAASCCRDRIGIRRCLPRTPVVRCHVDISCRIQDLIGSGIPQIRLHGASGEESCCRTDRISIPSVCPG